MNKLFAILLTLVLTIGILPSNAFAAEFSDVPSDLYCHEPVNWAVANGITRGMDANHFGPEVPCIRRHVVMFLWRAMGKPEPWSMANPFVDVKHNSFEKAILWAYYEGITTGKDATHFNPEGICSRKQIVTFLWRANGKPEPQGMVSFPDVRNDRFAKPIYWAAENGITGGYKDGTFRPDATCTRGQIVTFLYRVQQWAPAPNPNVHAGRKLANFIRNNGRYDSTDNEYTYLYSVKNEGNVSLFGMTYSPNEDKIWMAHIFSTSSGDVTVAFNYSVSQMTNKDNLGLFLKTSSGDEIFTMAKFNMRTYSQGDYLYFQDIHGNTNADMNKLGSNMISLGVLGWQEICKLAGLTIQDIGFCNISNRAKSAPAAMFAENEVTSFCDKEDIAMFKSEQKAIEKS